VRVAGEWGLRHPDRPVTWLNSGAAGNKVMDLESRWVLSGLEAAHEQVIGLGGRLLKAADDPAAASGAQVYADPHPLVCAGFPPGITAAIDHNPALQRRTGLLRLAERCSDERRVRLASDRY
jgi:hypothetical protein